MAKFSEEVTGKILEALKTSGIDRAAQLAGISAEALRQWRRQGERDLAEGKRTKYSDFVEEIRKRQAHRVAILESSVMVAATKERDWRAAAWLLERTQSKEYGPKNFTEVQVKGELQTLLEQVQPLMPAQSYADLLLALRQIHADGDSLESVDSPEASTVIQ